MRIPTPADFRVLEDWGIISNPMAGIEDYSEEKAQRRWENDRHSRAYEEYADSQPEAFISDSQDYYQSMNRPIDRTKWEFLKHRKRWFHPPVEWGRFAAPGTSRILDLGCGDGDITQQVADSIAASWQRAGYDGFPLEIIGVDLNESRIANARNHTGSPHKKITLQFKQGDAIAGTDFVDDYFDYTLLAGVLEVLDQQQVNQVLDETARLTAKGLYIRDVLDDYPGLYPRPTLQDLLTEYGFQVTTDHKVLEEPFVEEGSRDPLEIWPMNENQVLFAEVNNSVSPEERY